MTPRTLYIDPGTARTAWLVAEPDPEREQQDSALPLRAIDCDKIETGTKVDRPPERVTSYVRADGVTVVQDKERIVTPADRRRVGDALVAIAAAHGVTRAVMELMGRVYLHGSPAAQRAQAESAKQVGKVEELILDRLHAAGVEVVTVARAKWAARLRVLLPVKVVGAPAMTRAQLLPILDVGFGGTWPAKAGEDERDAGGIALHDALPPLIPKRQQRTGARRKKTPGEVKPRGKRGELDRRKAREARSARCLARREAAGCTCGLHTGPHRKGCPRHVSKARWVETWVEPVEQAEARLARVAKREAREQVAAERARRRAKLAAHDRACDQKSDTP